MIPHRKPNPGLQTLPSEATSTSEKTRPLNRADFQETHTSVQFFY